MPRAGFCERAQPRRHLRFFANQEYRRNFDKLHWRKCADGTTDGCEARAFSRSPSHRRFPADLVHAILCRTHTHGLCRPRGAATLFACPTARVLAPAVGLGGAAYGGRGGSHLHRHKMRACPVLPESAPELRRGSACRRGRQSGRDGLPHSHRRGPADARRIAPARRACGGRTAGVGGGAGRPCRGGRPQRRGDRGRLPGQHGDWCKLLHGAAGDGRAGHPRSLPAAVAARAAVPHDLGWRGDRGACRGGCLRTLLDCRRRHAR